MNRSIDNLGRIVLPKEMRDKLGLKNGDEAFIELNNNKIVVSNPSKFNLEEYIKQQMEVFKDDCSAFNAYNDILNKIKNV